jgi:protein involved in polysaccharide export with SLBB domain
MKKRKQFSNIAHLSLALALLVTGTLQSLGDDEADRRIAPSDTISIEVFGEKDLTVERRVQASGTITFPLLGNVEVAGKTTAEVATLLQGKLDMDFLVNPQVSVNVKEYRSGTVSVMGHVEKKGAIKLPTERPMFILEAIAEAGGFSPTANKSKIELTRKGKTTRYKFDELRKETDPKKKIALEPDDVIYVTESFF